MTTISRRTFLRRSARATIGVSAGLAALGTAGLPRALAAVKTPKKKPLDVCLVSGSLEYQSDHSLAGFQQYVEKRHPIRCSRAFIRTESDLPGLEKLDHADCAIFFTRRLTLPAEQLEHVKRYCARGGAIVALRTASHGFQSWLAMDRDVLGGDYRGHYGNQFKTDVKIAAAAQDHPLLKGFQPFVSDGSLYKNAKIAADATVLLTGSIPDHAEPIAWVRRYRGGRVFYTSLGHPNDFRQDSFLQLLVNALFWATSREKPNGPL